MHWSNRILVLAPHADDETLGCGGLLLKYTGSERRVWIATMGRTPASRGEQTEAELTEAMLRLRVPTWKVGFVGHQGRLDLLGQSALVSAIDREIDEFRPTAVFAPYASHHQDHVALYHATLAAMRPRTATLNVKLFALYEYPYVAAWPSPEIPGGKFYMPMDHDALIAKLYALGAYSTQFDRDTWCSLARVEQWARQRGAEMGFEAAEAFFAVRGLLQ